MVYDLNPLANKPECFGISWMDFNDCMDCSYASQCAKESKIIDIKKTMNHQEIQAELVAEERGEKNNPMYYDA